MSALAVFVRSAWRFASGRVAEHRDAQERERIARAFNDRYTYRYGWGPRHAWMCPECNLVHQRIPSDYDFLTGHHFPACCSTPEGHRHGRGIRVQ